jgi:hypothetical protein
MRPPPSRDPPRIVLPAHEVAPFDPRQVYEERIGDRRVVYLDNNAWIYLRDEKTPEASKCGLLCRQSVDDGRAIFPVSYASVSELLEMKDQASRIGQADLMDALCLGVTFRVSGVVHDLEGEDVYRLLLDGSAPPGRRQTVFTGLPNYFADRLVSIPEGWHADDVTAYLAHYRRTAGKLRWMVEHFDSDQVAKNHARVNDYGALLDERRAAHRAHLGVAVVDRDALAHEERVSMVNSFVLPAIKRVGPPDGDPTEIARKLIELHGKLHGQDNRRTFRRAFRAAAPALEILAQIFARQSREVNRKTTRQDFWDVEHACLATAYADAFVSADNYLNEVLRLGERKPAAARAQMLSSLDELTTWLERLLAGP